MIRLNSDRVSKSLVGLAVLSTALLLSGCTILWDGIRGSGVDKTEVRQIGAFDQIELGGIGTANVRFGDEPSLKVTVDDNLLEYVTTEVVDGILKIEQSKIISPSKSLRFEIVATKLKAADISGAASLDIEGSQYSDLRLGISGAGKIVADGTADKLEIDMSGAATVDANELKAKSVKVSISGTGQADVYASESLDASISGAGLVNCLGKPAKVTQDISGVGRVNVPK